MYRFRARSGYNDLVDHAHECWNQKFPIRPTFRRLDVTLQTSQIAAKIRRAAPASHRGLDDIERKFQSCFQSICCKERTSGEL
jgi:hypothetical protein